mmetsp:Transcript_6499/g.8795  ORF Transcript_6499/g.8795 Transcript_6499/m.8795 type:complete len:198 (-) Transcript_6499:1750-2343(-)
MMDRLSISCAAHNLPYYTLPTNTWRCSLFRFERSSSTADNHLNGNIREKHSCFMNCNRCWVTCNYPTITKEFATHPHWLEDCWCSSRTTKCNLLKYSKRTCRNNLKKKRHLSIHHSKKYHLWHTCGLILSKNIKMCINKPACRDPSLLRGTHVPWKISVFPLSLMSSDTDLSAGFSPRLRRASSGSITNASACSPPL